MRFGAIAGPQGPAGSPFVPAGVLVYDEGDLPPPVGNVITGAAGVVYELMTEVTLTAGRRLVLPPSSALIGASPVACKLVGDVDGSLVTVSGAAERCRIDGVSITNANAGASARAVEFASAGSTLIMQNVRATAAQAGLYLTAIGDIYGLLSVFSVSAGSPVDISAGCTAKAFIDCRTVSTVAGGGHFRLRNGAAIASLTIRDHVCVASAANQKGVLQEGATIASQVSAEDWTTEGANAGTFSPNDANWSQATPGWIVRSVDGLLDSSAIGGSYFDNAAVLVPISAAGTWTPIAPAVGTPWVLESDSERFELVSAANGQIRYIGRKTRRFLVAGAMTLSKAGSTVSASMGIFVNGALHTPTKITSDVGTRLVALTCAPGIIVLNTNDTVDVRVRNNDNDNDFTVSDVSLGCAVAAIS